MRSNRFGGCFVLVALLLPGCTYVELKQPLIDAKSSKVDERLLGAWQMIINGEVPNASFRLARSAADPNVYMLLPVEEAGDEAGFLSICATTLQDKHYLSFEMPSKDQRGTNQHIAVRYELVGKGNEVQLSFLDSESLIRAINEGKLKGKFERIEEKSTPNAHAWPLFGSGPKVNKVVVDTDELPAFLAKHGDTVFMRTFVSLRRIEQK